MYTPKYFDESRTDVLHDLIRANSLATVVTVGSTGIVANHLPLFLAVPSTAGSLGTLRGHVSRSNPVWKDFDSKSETLAIFAGPAAYITPSWYPTKQETGQVVPTWNYVVVHAYGKLTAIEDRVWLRAHVEDLTQHKESPRPEPWRPSDAPGDFIERLLGGIVGFEIEISRIDGKWKTSQNQPERNRDGVIAGLEATGETDARAMARLVKERGPS